MTDYQFRVIAGILLHLVMTLSLIGFCLVDESARRSKIIWAAFVAMFIISAGRYMLSGLVI